PGALHQFGVGHDLGDKSPGLRRMSVYGVARVKKFACPRHADDTRQKPGATVAGDKADLEEGRAEDRRFGGKARIAKAGDIIAEADCGTVHGGDYRHLDAPDRAHDAMDAVAITLADMDARTGKALTPLAPRLDIATRRKRLARTRQNDAAHIAVGIDALRRAAEILRVLGRSQRIAALRPVDGQSDHMPFFFIDQRIAHCADAPP